MFTADNSILSGFVLFNKPINLGGLDNAWTTGVIPFAGYILKKKNLWYYKCNKIGCRYNKRAQLMHDLFVQELGKYRIDQVHAGALKVQLEKTFLKLTESGRENEKLYKAQLTEIRKRWKPLKSAMC